MLGESCFLGFLVLCRWDTSKRQERAQGRLTASTLGKPRPPKQWPVAAKQGTGVPPPEGLAGAAGAVAHAGTAGAAGAAGAVAQAAHTVAHAVAHAVPSPLQSHLASPRAAAEGE